MATVTLFKIAVTAESKKVALRLVKGLLLAAEVESKVTTAAGPYATGRLARSIHSVGPVITTGGVQGDLVADAPYAKAVHDGSGLHGPKHKAYPIFPKGARGVYRFGSRKKPQLKFFWRARGHIVFMPHVPGSRAKIGRSHPGQVGSHYLTNALKNNARRFHARVFIYDR